MSAVELKLYNLLKTDFNLSEDKALDFIKAIEKSQEACLESSMQEFKSIFKEDFHRLDLKTENVRLEVKESRNETLKWFIGLFFALALMILSLYLKK